jgi:hypothetical protein
MPDQINFQAFSWVDFRFIYLNRTKIDLFKPEPGSATGGEQIATKAPRHKENLQLLYIFASWCLGGANILPLKAQKLQLSAYC